MQKNLISVLADDSVCKYILNNPTPIPFNSNSLPRTITPTSPIYANISSSGVPGVIAIELKIVSGSGNTFVGDWIISFDETKSVRAHKPIRVSTTLIADVTVPALAKVTSCMGSSQHRNRIYYFLSSSRSVLLCGITAVGMCLRYVYAFGD